MRRNWWTRQRVFAISSAFLILGGFFCVVKDFNPEWKSYQKEFHKVTLKRAEQEIKTANQRIEIEYKRRLDELDRRIRELTDSSRSLNHQQLIKQKEAQIVELTQKEYEISQTLSFAKSDLGASRSRYEFMSNDPQTRKEDVEKLKATYETQFARVQELSPVADKAFADLTKAKDELKELQKGPADLVRDKEKINAEMAAWRKQVETINPSDLPNYTANVVRDLPLLDFIDPKFKLNQIVLVGSPDITHSDKVDRCITCHAGATDPGFDSPDVPVVFRTHPKLDLYLGKGSPHPIDKFACTTCHLGRGYGTTFNLAGHTPNSPEQAKEWKEKYGWDYMHYWDYPMLPKKNNEAMCFNCHKSTYELTMAKDLFAGRKIYERRGCHGCHKIEGVSNDMNKVGPTLKKIASKLDPAWTPRWIKAPRSFYAEARMPHPFGHQIPSENTHPEYLHHLEHGAAAQLDAPREKMLREDDVMIDAISTWLYEKTDPNTNADMEEPPAQEGDVEKGKELVKVVNCLGCHKVDQLEAPGQGYGPDLSKIGTKTNRKWLFNWIKDPQKYWPETNMPNPRLTDEEINHVAAYLMTLKDEEFKQKPIIPNDSLIEEIAVRYKRAKLSESDAVAQVKAMNPHERKLYVGQESVYRRGCFGCHDIAGFETFPKVGAELSAEGFKEIELFDFGVHKYVHIPHSRHDWISKKVDQPFVYFLGKVQNPYEQTFYMPWFGFDEKENAQITTFIMGQVGKLPPPMYRYEPTGDKAAILAGSKIIERRNCVGCHPVGVGWQFMEASNVGGSKDLLWLKDALVAHFDPNLPEGKFSKIDQLKHDEILEKDNVLIDKEGYVQGEYAVGEDIFAAEELFGKEPIQVNIGAQDEVKIPLERPTELQVYGAGEGYISRYYEDRSKAPPALRHEGAKVNPDWFFNFIKKVTTIRTHIEVRMPQWDWTDQDATTVVKYFSAAAGEPFPYETVDKQPIGEVHSKTAKELFGLPGSPDYDKSLKCISCHPSGALEPTSPRENWGPDLYLSQKRLKIPFIESWLKDPFAWQPGTRMPRFFYDKESGKYIEIRPNADKEMHELAEMIHYFPDLEEVKLAAAFASEFGAKKSEGTEPTAVEEAPQPGSDNEDLQGTTKATDQAPDAVDQSTPQALNPPAPAMNQKTDGPTPAGETKTQDLNKKDAPPAPVASPTPGEQPQNPKQEKKSDDGFDN